MRGYHWIILGVVSALLTACQGEASVLPTVANPTAIAEQTRSAQATIEAGPTLTLDALATAEAAEANATPTTSRRPTLPPTFTPTASPAPTLDPATPTPENFNPAGTLFYIYNGDSIAAASGDGSFNDIIVTFGVGQAITDLALSPDEQLLAYVAPGSGSAREVFISNRDGTYQQKISCLGLSQLYNPTWSPDGATLVFYGERTPDGPRTVYLADVAGSNNCPAANNQRPLAQTDSDSVTGLAWTRGGSSVFYSQPAIYRLDLTEDIAPILYATGGLGAPTELEISPVDQRMIYLKPALNRVNNRVAGDLVVIQNYLDEPPPQLYGTFAFPIGARTLAWSRDARFILATTRDSVLLVEGIAYTDQVLVDDLPRPPSAAFSPDAREVAYTDLDANGVPQIFILGRTGGQVRQLTRNPEGSIDALIWAEG